jgi:glycosyltransferase involved in cell wall biosynthesis
MAKISVVINTYNAEQHLEAVLKSVQSFDEVLNCDMESTDSTLEIARRYGCRIVSFPKKNYVSAEPARTFAIQSASYDWVLVVDADELVPQALRDYLYAQVLRPDCPAGIYIPRKNYFMGRMMHCHYPDYLLRFFVKEGTVWPPYVHTFPVVKGRTEHIPRKRIDLAFEHLAKDGVADILRKTNQYTDNELKHRQDKNYGLRALIIRPLWRFIRNYFLKCGFRDGIPGFIRATLDAFYQFVLVAKIIEKRYQNK